MACGIDFGTSNSTVGLNGRNGPYLVPLEGDHPTIPSAVFFDLEDHIIRYGRDAVQAYTAQHEGRLLRALKSILGSALIEETTQVGNRQVAFKSIIGQFIGHLKARAELSAATSLSRVVLGRPVNFVDGDEDADRNAQDQLELIARGQGFREIAFQYEPVAAALDYEQRTTREELVLVADIGGGTSDFSLIRVGPDRAGKPDRWDDILANTGTHVGGTDFDYRLSVDQIMPLLGLGSRLRLSNGAEVNMPAMPYHDLATWHRIVLLYTRKRLGELADMKRDSLSPDLLERLTTVIEGQFGHLMAGRVEDAKVALSSGDRAKVPLDFIEDGLEAGMNRSGFETAIGRELTGIESAIARCIALAGIGANDVTAVFLTGGSTAVPAVTAACTGLVPHAPVIEGDKFGSVGIGLALDAAVKFGSQS